MAAKIQLERTLPEKLLTPAQIREGTHQPPIKQEFMEKNNFFPPMELTKDGKVLLHCTSEDLKDSLSQENKPVILKLTSKQAAVLKTVLPSLTIMEVSIRRTVYMKRIFTIFS